MQQMYASTHGKSQYDPNRQGFVQVELNQEWRRGQVSSLGIVVYNQFFKEDTDQCIGEPGFAEGMIPIWGNGRSAIHAARNGRYGSAVLYGAAAALDVFLITKLVTLAKGILKGSLALKVAPAAASGSRPLLSTQQLNSLAVEEYAGRVLLSEMQTAKTLKAELGAVVSIGQDKVTGKVSRVYFNDLKGKKPSDLSDTIAGRLDTSPANVKSKAGSHAEVYAVDELLKARPGAKLSDIQVLTLEIDLSDCPVSRLKLPFDTETPRHRFSVPSG